MMAPCLECLYSTTQVLLRLENMRWMRQDFQANISMVLTLQCLVVWCCGIAPLTPIMIGQVSRKSMSNQSSYAEDNSAGSSTDFALIAVSVMSAGLVPPSNLVVAVTNYTIATISFRSNVKLRLVSQPGLFGSKYFCALVVQ
uniref:G_PROTEIN_RECEP_F1_2 domain-containing protein n=1 Tax=Mesocestoides corti TaxID=53468 RepID=A0A5K3EYW7_MESCO